jgi:hypothetical protein
MTNEYLIWSHEHGAWWRAGARGYTRRLSEAGRYSRDNALLICANAIPSTADTNGWLPELPVRLADLHAMLRGPLGEEYETGDQSWE